jgi:hypothetical protein
MMQPQSEFFFLPVMAPNAYVSGQHTARAPRAVCLPYRRFIIIARGVRGVRGVCAV